MRRLAAVLFAVVLTALAMGTVPTSANADVAGSSLTMTSSTPLAQGDEVTFSFTTAAPSGTNWVGIYSGSTPPGDGASITWSYTPGASGTVTLDTSSLSGGPYTAYLLANNGYGILATSAPFSFQPYVAPPNPSFAISDFTARTVRTGRPFSAQLGGLWVRPTGSVGGAPTFQRVSGDSWLSVSADGTVSGTAPSKAPSRPSLITVQATDTAGHSEQLTVEVPVIAANAEQTLKTASLNLWDAGTHVDTPLQKQIAIVLGEDLDVVALQETNGTAATQLANALGWYSYQSTGDLGVISRYPLSNPLAPTAALPAAAVTVNLTATSAVRVWTAHLDETAYGPYAACLDGRSAAQILAAEQATTRAAQATALAAAMRSDIRKDRTVPVVLAADLASPSGLDWTARTSAAHCNVGAVNWPVTATLAQTGLVDTYRQLHPNPSTDPGNTWSPVLALHPGSTVAEPQDRIDYVDYAGALRPLAADSLVTGWPKDEPNTAGNSWPSDHAAAVATFLVQ